MKRFLLILFTMLLLGVPEIGAQRFARCQSCIRQGGRGRISRSVSVKREFVRRHPCPAVARGLSPRAGGGVKPPLQCPGFQVDHIVALACGGRDVAANLQWLSIAGHRAKTRRDAKCRF